MIINYTYCIKHRLKFNLLLFTLLLIENFNYKISIAIESELWFPLKTLVFNDFELNYNTSVMGVTVIDEVHSIPTAIIELNGSSYLYFIILLLIINYNIILHFVTRRIAYAI